MRRLLGVVANKPVDLQFSLDRFKQFGAFPYKRLINKLISLFEGEMYDRKERLVERLQEMTR